jgi:hypothetical protein
MLAKDGFDASCLPCGTHWPLSERAARRLAELSIPPSALHNNCSGGDPTPAAGSKPASAPTGNRRAKPTTAAADAADQTVTN